MHFRRLALPALISLALAPLFLSPNPFGNLPLGMVDEEVFVRTALSALSNATIPALDTPGAGFAAPYGAVMVYLLYIVLAPAYLLAAYGLGSWHDAYLALAARTGDLIQLARWIDGAAVLALVTICIVVALRSLSARLRVQLLLFVTLLLGNAAFLSLAHTGKMWLLQVVFEATAGLLCIARETYGDRHPILGRYYVRALIIIAALAASQSFMGLLASLPLVYAIYLRHTSTQDIWRATVSLSPWLILILLLQYATLSEGLRVTQHAAAGVTHITGGNSIGFAARAIWPWEALALAAPTTLIAYVVALALWSRQTTAMRTDRRLHIALIHPLIYYVLYFLVFGFEHLLRYIVPLSLAMALATVLIAPHNTKVARMLLAFAGASALVISVLTATFWWQRSSDDVIMQGLLESPRLNAPNTLLIIEPIQLSQIARYSEPNNEHTARIVLTHATRTDAARFDAQWRDMVFVRAVMTSGRTLYSSVQIVPGGRELPRVARPAITTYVITDRCERRCTEDEVVGNVCLPINAARCDIDPLFVDDIYTVPALFQLPALGRPYFVRRL